MTILDLLTPIVAALNTADEGKESNAPIFLYGPKSFQNLSDDVDVTNGVCYLDEPLISQDELHTSGYLEERYQLGILFGYRGAIDFSPADERILIDKARERRRMFINLLSLSKLVRRITNVRTTDITKEYDLSLSGCFIQFDLTPINQLSNCTPEMVEAVEEAEEEQEDLGTEVVFDTEAEKDIETIVGANLFQSYDAPFLAGWTDEAIDLNFQGFFLTFASMSNGNATIFQTFFTAAGDPIVSLYLPIAVGFDPAFVYANWATGKFNPTGGIALDQESDLGSKQDLFIATLDVTEQGVFDAAISGGATPQEALEPIYISRARATMAQFPSYPAWWDVPNVQAVAGNAQARKVAIRPLTDTPIMRQYEHVSPDAVQWIEGDHAGNLVKILQYITTLLPSYDDMIFVDAATKFPNITKKVILQRLAHESGTDALSPALNNILLSLLTQYTLANTERYDSVFWMRFGEIVRPEGVALGIYDATKRTNKPYYYAKTFPITFPFVGVTGQGFSDGADSFAMMITNVSGTDYSMTTLLSVIPGKTISGDFTYDRGWAATLGGTVVNETGTEAALAIKKYGNVFAEFETV